jgi:hypothetical protein
MRQFIKNTLIPGFVHPGFDGAGHLFKFCNGSNGQEAHELHGQRRFPGAVRRLLVGKGDGMKTRPPVEFNASRRYFMVWWLHFQYYVAGGALHELLYNAAAVLPASLPGIYGQMFNVLPGLQGPGYYKANGNLGFLYNG